jgi:hypothetical protein
MQRPTLSKGAVREIGAHVDGVFDGIKQRFLGPDFYRTRRPVYVHQPKWSLPALYRDSARDEAVTPNEAILASLAKVAEGYLDAQKEITKARVIHSVNTWLATPSEKPIGEVLGAELKAMWARVKDEVVKIANSEGTTARNMGTLEGVIKSNALLGIEDPIVAFIGPKDEYTCKECIRVLYQADGVTPRVFRLSEVSHAYHERGTDTPSISGMHPQCLHSLVTIMPGYGFDENGKIRYRGRDHSELEAQRPAPKKEPV